MAWGICRESIIRIPFTSFSHFDFKNTKSSVKNGMNIFSFEKFHDDNWLPEVYDKYEIPLSMLLLLKRRR